MPRITDEVIDVPLAGQMVKGVLNGTEESWDFKSPDLFFMEYFPAGIVYSFSHYGEGQVLHQQRLFQELIRCRVKELTDAQRFQLVFEPVSL